MTGSEGGDVRRRTVLGSAGLITAASVLAPVSAHADTTAATPAGRPSDPGRKPTVVLVHGAFADASGFGDVIAGLQRHGYTVLAPPNPLRGLASDSASIKTFLGTVDGRSSSAGTRTAAP